MIGLPAGLSSVANLRERRSRKRSSLDVGFDPLSSPPRQIIAQTRPGAGAASQASPGLDLRSGRSFVSHYVQPPVRPESTSWPFPVMLDGAVPIWSRRPSASTPARTHGILRGLAEHGGIPHNTGAG